MALNLSQFIVLLAAFLLALLALVLGLHGQKRRLSSRILSLYLMSNALLLFCILLYGFFHFSILFHSRSKRPRLERRMRRLRRRLNGLIRIAPDFFIGQCTINFLKVISPFPEAISLPASMLESSHSGLSAPSERQ